MESVGGVETRVDRTPCGGVADGYLGVDFDTPPRIGNRMTPSNSQSRVKVSAGRDLVSKSAMLLAEETWDKSMEPSATFSRRKWCRMAMCFDLSWCTGFLESAMQPLLSL
jgi:hypothetical protein